MNVGEMQRKLSQWAAQDKNRRFNDLYSLLCDPEWLRLAHDHVVQNTGSKTAGCDGINMAEFDTNLEDNLQSMRQALKAEQFVACPVRRVYIPKSNGKVRPLGIPNIRDRIVQEAIRMILEPIYEADFSQNSFGFRPNRRTMDAINYIRMWTQEPKFYFWVIEGDISAYFDTINHRKLMRLLRQRVTDSRLLDLLWNFLRAGVMERKLFKDTKLGTPQGGIISPLLANVYLHELDQFMNRYIALPTKEKARRRRKGLANYAYARYADDFIILCNGTKEQALGFRDELHMFLATRLRLTLSLEKTKVTHLNDGFDFLGFRVKRRMGPSGMRTEVTISENARERHRTTLRMATSRTTHNDSVICKILAINRIIAGWCRYYQYTNSASYRFNRIAYETWWRFAHWLAGKHKSSISAVCVRYRTGNSFAVGELTLKLHDSFKAARYTEDYRKPNPYTSPTQIEREELLELCHWLGTEVRPGSADLRPVILARDQYRCQICRNPVTDATCQVDHIRPVRYYKRPSDANHPSNLWTLCTPCHTAKTESDRLRESRMQ